MTSILNPQQSFIYHIFRYSDFSSVCLTHIYVLLFKFVTGNPTRFQINLCYLWFFLDGLCILFFFHSTWSSVYSSSFFISFTVYSRLLIETKFMSLIKQTVFIKTSHHPRLRTIFFFISFSLKPLRLLSVTNTPQIDISFPLTTSSWTSPFTSVLYKRKQNFCLLLKHYHYPF